MNYSSGSARTDSEANRGRDNNRPRNGRTLLDALQAMLQGNSGNEHTPGTRPTEQQAAKLPPGHPDKGRTLKPHQIDAGPGQPPINVTIGPDGQPHGYQHSWETAKPLAQKLHATFAPQMVAGMANGSPMGMSLNNSVSNAIRSGGTGLLSGRNPNQPPQMPPEASAGMAYNPQLPDPMQQQPQSASAPMPQPMPSQPMPPRFSQPVSQGDIAAGVQALLASQSKQPPAPPARPSMQLAGLMPFGQPQQAPQPQASAPGPAQAQPQQASIGPDTAFASPATVSQRDLARKELARRELARRGLSPAPSQSNPAFEQQAAQLDPTGLQIARSKNDAFGQYLRGKAAQAQPGETTLQQERRLYGNPMEGPSKPYSFATGAVDTLLLGASDEIGAGVGSLFNGKSYDENLQHQRQVMDMARNENPKTYMAGQVAGAAAPLLVSGGATAAPSLAARMGQSALSAGLTSAAYGYGSGEGGAVNRLQNAAVQGTIGAATGGAFPVAAKPLGVAWRGVTGWLANRGVDAKAANIIAGKLQEQGMTPMQAQAHLAKLGPDAMLADLEGMRVDAAGLARANPQAGQLMGERLASRREGARPRVDQSLDDAFGVKAVDPYTVRSGTTAARKALSPEYKAALANAPELPKSTADLFAKGLTDPSKSLSLENRKFMGGFMSQVDDALAAGDKELAASRLLDLRKSLDAQIVRNPRLAFNLTPEQKAQQGVLNDARKFLDGFLKEHVPGLIEADAKYASTSKLQSAFDMGRKDVLSGGTNAMTPAELSSLTGPMTSQEKAMAQQGVRTELDRYLSNQRAEPSATVDRITSRDWNRAKLETLIGKSKTDKLAADLDREGTYLETSNMIEPGRGSRTAVLSAAADKWAPKGGKGVTSAIKDASIAGAAGMIYAPGSGAGSAAFVGSLLNSGRHALTEKLGQRAGTKMASEIADRVTRTGADRDQVLQLVDKILSKDISRSATHDKLTKLLQSLTVSQGAISYQDGQRR